MRGKSDSATRRWIYHVAGEGKKWIGLLTLVRVLQGVNTILYAYALKNVVNCATAGQQEGFVSQICVFAAINLWSLILLFFSKYCAEKGSAVLQRKFRMHIFSQLLRRDYAKVSREHTGEWMNRITSDTNVVITAAANIVPQFFGLAVRLTGVMVALLMLIPQILYVLLPGAVVMVAFSYVLRKYLKPYHKAVQKSDGKVRSFIQERLSSLLVIHTFTQESAAEQAAVGHMKELEAARMRRHRFVNLCGLAVSGAMTAAQVIGVGVCCWGLLQSTMTYGTMSAVMYLVNLLESPLANISGVFSQYYSMVASAERLMEIEELPLDMEKDPVAEEKILQYYASDFGALGLENVCFAYEDSKDGAVLDDLSLEVQKGEFVAFTGESGCGKSTALKVLLSLYPVNSGMVYLRSSDGGKEVLDARWRGLFAYVPQGNQLISGTIRQTLVFADSEKMEREQEIWEALRIACAEEFVSELPQGLDTQLGERGSGLSEGQLQRLAIARAILSRRPVLLLDEATSALDAVTEEKLLQNLRAMTDRTVLIITHREAVVDSCHKRIHFEKKQ